MAQTCKRCGSPHYNFQECPPAPKSAGEKFLRPREGARDFGNRFSTMTGRDFGGSVQTFIPRKDHPMYLETTPPKEAA